MLAAERCLPAQTAPCRAQQRRQAARAARRAQPCRAQPAEVVYHDSWSDIAFIALCRRAYGKLAGWQSSRGWRDGEETYKGMVEVSKALMKGRSAAQQREAVVQGFPRISPAFRKLFPFTRKGAELNAQLTLRFFPWLVGPMQVDADDKAVVRIERCRYLAESKCAGMCVNLCKAPVQTFFTHELGVPLLMEPNFETYECSMTFGKHPPPLEQDEGIRHQGCLLECSMGVCDSGQCRKLQ